MASQHSINIVLLGVILPLFIACGPKSNLFNYITPSAQKNSFDSLLDRASAAYDSGRYEEAQKLASKANELNPDSERAAILLGYAHLSLAGIGPFNLIKKLVEIEAKKKNSGTKLADTDQSTGTAKVLSELNDLLGLSSADLQKLGEKDETDPELPVILPKCAEEVRPQIKTLFHANKAIEATCRFVDPDSKISSDSRHKCEGIKGNRALRSKSHFVWAFSHLAEALAFHSILLYSTTSTANSTDKTTNLEKRFTKLKDQKVEGTDEVKGFINTIESLDKTVSAILPTGTSCSANYPTTQMTAMLNDLLSVDAAFRQIAGIPKAMTGAIGSTIDKVKSLSSQTGSETAALKSQLTQKLSQTLTEKLNELKEKTGQDLSTEDVSKLCGALGSISGQSEQGAQASELCK